MDEMVQDTFHKVTEMQARSGERARVIEEWVDAVLDKLTPRKIGISVIKPKMMLRAYEVLVDRREVNDESVEDLVNARFDKWVEEWRRHVQLQKRERRESPITNISNAIYTAFSRASCRRSRTG